MARGMDMKHKKTAAGHHSSRSHSHAHAHAHSRSRHRRRAKTTSSSKCSRSSSGRKHHQTTHRNWCMGTRVHHGTRLRDYLNSCFTLNTPGSQTTITSPPSPSSAHVTQTQTQTRDTFPPKPPLRRNVTLPNLQDPDDRTTTSNSSNSSSSCSYCNSTSNSEDEDEEDISSSSSSSNYGDEEGQEADDNADHHQESQAAMKTTTTGDPQGHHPTSMLIGQEQQQQPLTFTSATNPFAERFFNTIVANQREMRDRCTAAQNNQSATSYFTSTANQLELFAFLETIACRHQLLDPQHVCFLTEQFQQQNLSELTNDGGQLVDQYHADVIATTDQSTGALVKKQKTNKLRSRSLGSLFCSFSSSLIGSAAASANNSKKKKKNKTNKTNVVAPNIISSSSATATERLEQRTSEAVEQDEERVKTTRSRSRRRSRRTSGPAPADERIALAQVVPAAVSGGGGGETITGQTSSSNTGNTTTTTITTSISSNKRNSSSTKRGDQHQQQHHHLREDSAQQPATTTTTTSGVDVIDAIRADDDEDDDEAEAEAEEDNNEQETGCRLRSKSVGNDRYTTCSSGHYHHSRGSGSSSYYYCCSQQFPERVLNQSEAGVGQHPLTRTMSSAGQRRQQQTNGPLRLPGDVTLKRGWLFRKEVAGKASATANNKFTAPNGASTTSTTANSGSLLLLTTGRLLRKKWKKRFCLLTSAFVLYVFADEQETRLLDTILLPSYRIQLVSRVPVTSPPPPPPSPSSSMHPLPLDQLVHADAKNGCVREDDTVPNRKRKATSPSARSSSGGTFLAFTVAHQGMETHTFGAHSQPELLGWVQLLSLAANASLPTPPPVPPTPPPLPTSSSYHPAMMRNMYNNDHHHPYPPPPPPSHHHRHPHSNLDHDLNHVNSGTAVVTRDPRQHVTSNDSANYRLQQQSHTDSHHAHYFNHLPRYSHQKEAEEALSIGRRGSVNDNQKRAPTTSSSVPSKRPALPSSALSCSGSWANVLQTPSVSKDHSHLVWHSDVTHPHAQQQSLADNVTKSWRGLPQPPQLSAATTTNSTSGPQYHFHWPVTTTNTTTNTGDPGQGHRQWQQCPLHTTHQQQNSLEMDSEHTGPPKPIRRTDMKGSNSTRISTSTSNHGNTSQHNTTSGGDRWQDDESQLVNERLTQFKSKLKASQLLHRIQLQMQAVHRLADNDNVEATSNNAIAIGQPNYANINDSVIRYTRGGSACEQPKVAGNTTNTTTTATNYNYNNNSTNGSSISSCNNNNNNNNGVGQEEVPERPPLPTSFLIGRLSQMAGETRDQHVPSSRLNYEVEVAGKRRSSDRRIFQGVGQETEDDPEEADDKQEVPLAGKVAIRRSEGADELTTNNSSSKSSNKKNYQQQQQLMDLFYQQSRGDGDEVGVVGEEGEENSTTVVTPPPPYYYSDTVIRRARPIPPQTSTTITTTTSGNRNDDEEADDKEEETGQEEEEAEDDDDEEAEEERRELEQIERELGALLLKKQRLLETSTRSQSVVSRASSRGRSPNSRLMVTPGRAKTTITTSNEDADDKLANSNNNNTGAKISSSEQLDVTDWSAEAEEENSTSSSSSSNSSNSLASSVSLAQCLGVQEQQTTTATSGHVDEECDERAAKEVVLVVRAESRSSRQEVIASKFLVTTYLGV